MEQIAKKAIIQKKCFLLQAYFYLKNPKNLPNSPSLNGTLFVEYYMKTLHLFCFLYSISQYTMDYKIPFSRNDDTFVPFFTKLCESSPNKIVLITLSKLTNKINSMSFHMFFRSYTNSYFWNTFFLFLSDFSLAY